MRELIENLEEGRQPPYEDRMTAGVSREDLASHKHFLKKTIPLKKTLEQMQRDGDHGVVFSSKEQKQFADFIRLLGRKMVPVALVKVDTSKADVERDLMLKMIGR